jgi:UDP-N-acetylmuramoyl-tripeptide--D-alanyl-D-alanine ligase
MMLSLGFVIETLTDYRTEDDGPAISSVVIDSREAIAGSLFVAFKGDRLDGHDYVSDAFDRGAIAALVEHDVQGEFDSLDARNSEFESFREDWAPERRLCILVDSTKCWKNDDQGVDPRGSFAKLSDFEVGRQPE